MEGRAAGEVTMKSAMLMQGIVPYEGKVAKPLPWNKIPYNPKGGGCGCSIRTMCIGLRYPGEDNRAKLTSVSIEAGRITHNHPVAFLGGFASAIFTAFAVEGIEMELWGKLLIDNLPKAISYLKHVGRDVDNYSDGIKYFENSWKLYLTKRAILNGGKPEFPYDYEDVVYRDKFYKTLSFDGWAGSSGHDSVIIAYDALLYARDNWEKLCLHGMLHAGDSDSTGTIAGALYGILYGLEKVPEGNHKFLEYRDRMVNLGKLLFMLGGTVFG